jgi:RHS repeat-associated protein
MPKRYRYTGKERDEESGLYYYGARYYAAWLGRWTSVDPAMFKSIRFEDTVLLPYVYVENKPVIAVDPDGEALNFIAAAVGAAVGAVVGGAIEAGRQYITTGKVSDWKAVGASAVGGAVSGAVAGLTLGASLAAQATSAAVGG